MLIITWDKLHILDIGSNTLQQNFRVSDFSLEERGTAAANPEEVEIQVVAKTMLQAGTPKFQQVEFVASYT